MSRDSSWSNCFQLIIFYLSSTYINAHIGKSYQMMIRVMLIINKHKNKTKIKQIVVVGLSGSITKTSP
jgi:hypothetical protein